MGQREVPARPEEVRGRSQLLELATASWVHSFKALLTALAIDNDTVASAELLTA